MCLYIWSDIFGSIIGINEKIRNCSKQGKLENNQGNQELLDRLPWKCLTIMMIEFLYSEFENYSITGTHHTIGQSHTIVLSNMGKNNVVYILCVLKFLQ